MRSIFWFLWLAAVAVGLALLVGDNTATVTVFLHPWRLDVSLTLALIVLVVGFVLLYLALRGVSIVRNLPAKAHRWRASQQERSVYVSLLDALIFQLAGRFVRAQSAAQHAIHLLESMEPDVMGRQAQWRVLAQLLLAESARSLGHAERQQAAMQAAVSETASDAASALEGALLRALSWAIEDREADTAHGWLKQLPQGARRRIQAIRLRLKLAQLEQDAPSAVDTIRLLTKYKAVTPSAAETLLRGLLKQALAQALDREQLTQTWKSFDARERADPGLVLHCLERWQTVQATGGEAEEINAVDSPRCIDEWVSVLWKSFGQLTESRRVRAVRCLVAHLPERAADWLPRVEALQQSRPADAELQFLAGQAFMTCQLWGRAHWMLSQAVRQLTDAGLKRQAWRSLAWLAEQRGDTQEAADAWRAAAHCD
jgi:HemY protein